MVIPCWAFCILSRTCLLKTALYSWLFDHGLYFIHAAHRHKKEEDLWGLKKILNLRPPIGPGEEVCRKLGRAISAQDHLSENMKNSDHDF